MEIESRLTGRVRLAKVSRHRVVETKLYNEKKDIQRHISQHRTGYN